MQEHWLYNRPIISSAIISLFSFFSHLVLLTNNFPYPPPAPPVHCKHMFCHSDTSQDLFLVCFNGFLWKDKGWVITTGFGALLFVFHLSRLNQSIKNCSKCNSVISVIGMTEITDVVTRGLYGFSYCGFFFLPEDFQSLSHSENLALDSKSFPETSDIISFYSISILGKSCDCQLAIPFLVWSVCSKGVHHKTPYFPYLSC